MIFPRLTSDQNVLRWATQLVGVLGKNRDEIFSSFTRQDTGGTIRLNGRIQVNQNITDPDVTTDDREGEIRYNAATSKFQGFNGTSWQDFH
tara:strand:- start:139 stop:411 length:273 start_codon:yes stop_codon:yes gene_type:complete